MPARHGVMRAMTDTGSAPLGAVGMAALLLQPGSAEAWPRGSPSVNYYIPFPNLLRMSEHPWPVP